MEILLHGEAKKQSVVARLSVEVEFRGMSFGICEALWLKLLLNDFGYPPRQPIQLYYDNKITCDIAHNPIQHDSTKHVEADRFLIKEKLMRKLWSCLKFDPKINWPMSSPKQFQIKYSQSSWIS